MGAGTPGRGAVASAFLFASALALPARAQEAPRSLVVRVVTEAERAPLGYSVVALPALGIERLSPVSGAIALSVPAPGPQRLVVKRLGFSPKDTTITVGEAPSQTVVIALTRLSFRLNEVRVVAWPPCTSPGLPRTGGDRELRELVGQLRQNAERYRLLVGQYPFVYTMQREFGHYAFDSSYVGESRDVIPVSAQPGWTYRPGTLVAREPRSTVWSMRIPSISDLAEDAFVDNHCFHVAGIEAKEGERLLRLDIIAAARLRDPDVNVVVWLDPHDFQLRHATFSLTKTPPQIRGLVRSTSRVAYHELIPFVPVMRSMVAENVVREPRPPRSLQVLVERQTIQALVFSGPRPEALLRDSLPPP